MEQEHAWIQAALGGDKKAFERLVNAYKGPVYNLAYRILGDREAALDAAQETFLRAYIHLDTYQPGRKFSSWILSIASHYCIDLLRRRRVDVMPWEDLEPEPALAGGPMDPEGAALRSETRDEVQRLLERLPPAYRVPLVLRYWHDLSYQEIAQVTGLTVSAVKTRLHRARLMLARGRSVPGDDRAQAEEVRPGRGGWASASGDGRVTEGLRAWIVNGLAS